MNIVTIDFDVIMSPSINFYNDLVGGKHSYEDYLKNFSFLANLPADLYQYEYLTRFLILCLKKDIPIYFISSHEDVITVLDKEEMQSKDNVCYNIDHHHDVGYSDKIVWNTNASTYSCADWVKFGKDNNYFGKYIWIKNDNSSEEFSSPMVNKYINEFHNFSLINLEKIAEDTDILIVCASYDWVPPVYHPLFLTWQTICEEVANKDFLIDNFN